MLALPLLEADPQSQGHIFFFFFFGLKIYVRHLRLRLLVQAFRHG